MFSISLWLTKQPVKSLDKAKAGDPAMQINMKENAHKNKGLVNSGC